MFDVPVSYFDFCSFMMLIHFQPRHYHHLAAGCKHGEACERNFCMYKHKFKYNAII